MLKCTRIVSAIMDSVKTGLFLTKHQTIYDYMPVELYTEAIKMIMYRNETGIYMLFQYLLFM